MKHLIFFTLVFSLLFLTLGCLKEETNKPIEEPIESIVIPIEYQEFDLRLLGKSEERNGNVPDNMIHLQSLSYENVWLSEHTKAPIKHVLFNKAKIRNIIFSDGLYPDINYNGSTWRHYTLRINYNDNDTESLTGYVKDIFENYIYVPHGTNYLTAYHISNYVMWEQNLSIDFEQGINEYRNSNIRIYTWNISYFHSGNLTHITSKKLYPPSARTNTFTILHLD